jgi:hypothetical protein
MKFSFAAMLLSFGNVVKATSALVRENKKPGVSALAEDHPSSQNCKF